MTTINTFKPLSAEKLFALLKTEFADYINVKLGLNLPIEYAHVYNEINILFPEVIDGPALNIAVADVDLTVSQTATDSDYNTALLEGYLIGFLESQVG